MINNSKLTIIVAVFTISFIGYNVLTAEARDEEQDKIVCEKYNGEWKDVGDGEKACKIEDPDDLARYGMRPGWSLDGTGSDVEYGIEDMYPDNEEAKAAEEDYLCEDEDADTTDIEVCMSEEREHHYVDQQIEKKVCKDEGFEWKHNGGCDTKGDDKKWDEVYSKVGKKLEEREIKERAEEEEQPVIEDWKNEVNPTTTVVDVDEKQLKEIAQQIAEEDEGNKVQSSPVQTLKNEENNNNPHLLFYDDNNNLCLFY